METKEFPGVYPYSLTEAKRLNEEKLWKASHADNVACRKAIEAAILLGHDGTRLSKNCAEGVIAEFGYHRTAFVLANSLKKKEDGGRVSAGNRDWAKGFYIPDDGGYGSANWYDWSIANWGTKWNSYGYHDYTEKDLDGATLTFDTAWSSPQPVIATLAKKFPDLHFSHKWADEDFGYNVGEKEYTDGEESFSNVPEGGSKEALELAAEVRGVDLADEGYLFNEATGQYEYHNPDESMSLQMQ